MLAIAGGKGGCGKTTTTLCLGRELARRGREPVLVDCDSDMPDLHHYVGIERDDGVDELARGKRIERVCRRTTAVPGVRIVTAGRRENVLPALEHLRTWHGPVLLDCPPGTGPDAVRPLRRAEWALLVTTDQPQSQADTQTTARSVRELGTAIQGTVVRITDGQRSEPLSPDVPILTRIESVEDPLSDPRIRPAWSSVVDRLKFQ